MKIIDTFHPVHYESEKIERLGLLKGFSADKYGKGVSLSHNSLKHVNGEIEATMNSIIKAISLGFKRVLIYHDFEGIARWASMGGRKAKKEETRFVADNYMNFIRKMRTYIDIYFIKVKSHDGVYYNEMADMLAKQACGNRLISPLKRTKKKHIRN